MRSHRDIEVRAIEGEDFSDAFLTAAVGADRAFPEAARALFDDLATRLTAGRIQPFQEKIYGLRRVRDQVLAIRSEAYARAGLDPRLPCTYHDGAPIHGGELAGAQIWGVAEPNGSDGPPTHLSTVALGDRVGRTWCGPGYELLYIPGVRGTGPDGQLAATVTEQAAQMFVNAESLLQASGQGFGQVIRTWIYLGRILDWYGEFNRVRTDFFRKHQIGRDGAFPASTGIQGITSDEECSIDLLALKTDAGAGVQASPMLRSARQEQSFDYGSAFSRAMRLQMPGRQIIFISGTASIDTRGNTTHVDDPEAQIVQTLLNVAALLDDHGGGLSDICQATLFCRRAEYAAIYDRVTRLLGIPEIPMVPVVADVCRSDLLVEIEAIAVLPTVAASDVRGT